VQAAAPAIDFNRIAGIEDAPPRPAVDFDSLAPADVPAAPPVQEYYDPVERVKRGAMLGAVWGFFGGVIFATIPFVAMGFLLPLTAQEWLVSFPIVLLQVVLIAVTASAAFGGLLGLLVRKPLRGPVTLGPESAPEKKGTGTF